MRLGLDLRGLDGAELIERAIEADRFGLWAVLVTATAGAESLVAAEVATATDHVHVATWFRDASAHPLEIAEELAVLDHLSRRRALGVVDADDQVVDHVRHLLAGHIVDGVALAPPPAQTSVPIWSAQAVEVADLTGDLDTDRRTIDNRREQGHTHLFVTWAGSVRMLARHLASRAAGPDFPQITADHADVIAP